MKTKRAVKEPRKKQATFGLVANGSLDGWDVSIDETTEGPQRWFVQIDGPACYLYFRVWHPDVIQSTLDFLRGHLCPDQCHDNNKRSSRRAQPRELELSDLDGMSISLLWDVEAKGRCVILIRGNGEFVSRVTIESSESAKLAGSLEQVRDQLQEDGLLSEA
jgi:hypothetical protein